MKFVCDNCGEVDHVLIDGHHVAERFLEGIMFEIRIKHEKFQDKVIAVAQDKYYFKDSGLSISKWEKEMLEYAIEDIKDNGCCTMICPKCNSSEVILFEE